jgi:hypothetical protein
MIRPDSSKYCSDPGQAHGITDVISLSQVKSGTIAFEKQPINLPEFQAHG